MPEELQLGFAAYLRDHHPEALECKVEKRLKEEAFDVLWSPPYTPDLQPIEVFWAVGKNRVAAQYRRGRTMKQTIQQLREGRYGSIEEAPDVQGNRGIHKAIDCEGLYRKAIKIANQKFVPLCPRISGTLGSLEVSRSPRAGTAAYPIDLVVAEYASIEEEDDEKDGVLPSSTPEID